MITASIKNLTAIYSENIIIEINDFEINEAKKSTSQNYSNQTSKNYAYKNKLIRDAFVKYLQANLFTNNEKITVNDDTVWEFINGSSIAIELIINENDDLSDDTPQNLVKKVKKLILIPSENLDIEECSIPAEWVDIPNFAGDYYLPVQLNLDKKYLHFWGYISRQSLKQKADYNNTFHNYYVHQTDLITDLDLLWVALSICEEKGEVKLLPQVSVKEVKNTIAKLTKVTRYSPRLEVDFQKWATLLNNEESLKTLYQQRVNPKAILPSFTNLEKWLQQEFDQALELGWGLVSNHFTPQTLACLPMTDKDINQSVEKAKTIKFSRELEEKTVIFFLQTTKNTNNNRYEVLMQVYPDQSEKYLPLNLSFTIRDLESDTNIQTIISQKGDRLIQTKFNCDQEDKFRITLTLDEIEKSEDFCF